VKSPVYAKQPRDIIAAKMPQKRMLTLIAVLVLVLSHRHLAAQTAKEIAVEQKVTIAFFANDNHNEPVATLTQADIAVLDDKKAPQVILGLKGRTDLPLRLGIVIDASNSERKSGLYQPAIQAAMDFLNKVLASPEDRVFVERFDVLPEATEFVNRQQYPAIKLDLAPAGPTALYDALRFACEQRLKGGSSQDSFRVIVLLSDGGDNQSHNTRKDAIASAQRAGAVIFAVSTDENTYGGGETMKHLADETGGIAFLHLNKKDLPRVFTIIKEQIENLRLLSYIPADPVHDGQYRSVELKPSSKNNLKLRFPKGYFVTAP
jgi:Ca-activated chloride channel family protein